MSIDFVLCFGMSFNYKWYFLSQDNTFFTSSLQLIVLATKICPQGEKVLVHLETKVFYLWYLLQHRHINHAIVTQLHLHKTEIFWQNWVYQPWQFCVSNMLYYLRYMKIRMIESHYNSNTEIINIVLSIVMLKRVKCMRITRKCQIIYVSLDVACLYQLYFPSQIFFATFI